MPIHDPLREDKLKPRARTGLIHTYNKITEWTDVISKVLQDLDVLRENVYNIGKTGVLFSMLNSVKVLVGKDDLRGHRGAGMDALL